jgi:osmotically-inducible protein OsmY
MYNASFDEANYYQGNRFQLGGNDRKLILNGPTISTGNKIPIQRDDERLREDAWHALKRNYKLELSGIDLLVSNGILNITGTVNSLGQKHAAEKTIESVPGVNCIINDLRLGPIQQNED